jgi:hypothetical protein
MFIFIVGLTVYYYANTNISSDDKERFDDLTREGDALAAQLLTQGYPAQWDLSTVELIGVVSGQHLDASKWLAFSAINYSESRRLFGTQYDYLVFIAEKNGSVANISSRCGIGDLQFNLSIGSNAACPLFTIDSLGHRDLSRSERYVFFGDRVVKIVVYLWS